jgi:hypothetical protein
VAIFEIKKVFFFENRHFWFRAALFPGKDVNQGNGRDGEILEF